MFGFLPSFSSLKTIFVGIILVAIVSIIGLGYWHYTGLLSDVEILKANNRVLTSKVEAQDRTLAAQRDAIDEWEMALRNYQLAVEEMREVSEDAAAESKRLHELFSKHDLEELSREKPDLVERRLNRGTSRSLLLLECASGAHGVKCERADQAPDDEALSP